MQRQSSTEFAGIRLQQATNRQVKALEQRLKMEQSKNSQLTKQLEAQTLKTEKLARKLHRKEKRASEQHELAFNTLVDFQSKNEKLS